MRFFQLLFLFVVAGLLMQAGVASAQEERTKLNKDDSNSGGRR